MSYVVLQKPLRTYIYTYTLKQITSLREPGCLGYLIIMNYPWLLKTIIISVDWSGYVALE